MLQRAVEIPHQARPFVLEVQYQGSSTISSLLPSVVVHEPCIKERFPPPIDDQTLKIDFTGTMNIQVELAIDLTPTRHREYGLVFKQTPEILRLLQSLGMRALNIPETLALAAYRPDLNPVALGQEVQRQFGTWAMYVISGGIGWVPYQRSWGPNFVIPTTRAPDPLAN